MVIIIGVLMAWSIPASPNSYRILILNNLDVLLLHLFYLDTFLLSVSIWLFLIHFSTITQMLACGQGVKLSSCFETNVPRILILFQSCCRKVIVHRVVQFSVSPKSKISVKFHISGLQFD